MPIALVRLLGAVAPTIQPSHPVRQTIVWAYLIWCCSTQKIIIILILLLFQQLSFPRASFYATHETAAGWSCVSGLCVLRFTTRRRILGKGALAIPPNPHPSPPHTAHQQTRRTYPTTACLPDLPRFCLPISYTPKRTIQTHSPLDLRPYYFPVSSSYAHSIYTEPGNTTLLFTIPLCGCLELPTASVTCSLRGICRLLLGIAQHEHKNTVFPE